MLFKFKNLEDGGIKLAETLSGKIDHADTVLLALPRGGVPVAFEVAQSLNMPLDVLLVRKLGLPDHEEYAMGAIALGDIRVMNDDVIEQMDVSEEELERVIAREQLELSRRNRMYRQGRPPTDVRDKTVIVIDDGIATGATMMAAVKALRQMEAGHIIVAVPVGATSTRLRLEKIADQVICLHMPEPFHGVGSWYENFSQTTDRDVLEYLRRANNPRADDETRSPA
jgi:predicted phosphoribosyltransferase